MFSLVSQRPKSYSSLTIAGAFIGSMVGAGFASGQEIMQFFVYTGPIGIIGIICACLLFFYIGNLIMQMSHRSQTPTYRDLLQKVFGKSGWYLVFDALISFSYFGVLVVMTSGAGALFNEFVGLPFWLGGLFVLIPTFLTVLLGRSAVIRAISLVVPLALAGIILISVFTLWRNPLELADFSQVVPVRTTIAQAPFLISSVLYAAYNIILTLAVLTTLGQAASSPGSLRGGALLGALGIGIASLSIFAALATSLPETANKEIPMLYLALRINPLLAGCYCAVLLLEIYTSTLGLLYGLVDRLFKLPGSGKARINIAPAVLLICVGALLCSFIGFSNMVSSVYPLLGIGSTLFCFLLWHRRQTILGKRLF